MSITDEVLHKYGIDRSDPILPVLELQKDLQEENTEKIMSIFHSFDEEKVKSSVNLLGRVGMKLDIYSEELKLSKYRSIGAVSIGIVLSIVLNWGLHYILMSGISGEMVEKTSISDGVVYSVNIKDSRKVEVSEDVVKITY